MAQRPRIGISLDVGTPDEKRKMYELNADYPNAVLRAGGMPVLLPHTSDADIRLQMIQSIDGLILPGGADCDPRLYGQETSAKTDCMDPLRNTFDLALLALAEARNMPTLGICLGCQLMNVQRQGTLYQSITEAFPESTVRHAKLVAADQTNPTRSSFHELMIRPGTHLAAILDGVTALESNSRHRQAIEKLGHGLLATAFAPDGILEAIEDPTLRFWVGVQWHPENMPETPHAKLFAALVKAAAAPR
jgi:putative glutamine amidotransferase